MTIGMMAQRVGLYRRDDRMLTISSAEYEKARSEPSADGF